VTERDGRIRVRYSFRGIIQGVGFRPTVYRCAHSLGLSGFVRNERSEVVAELQGPAEAVRSFPDLLSRALPPAASVEQMQLSELPLEEGESSFRIVESRATPYSFPPIPPDLAICADCRRELLDPEDRRYLYPFITCTQCGPRYSIVEDTPFDRDTTSMVDFPQCPQCLAEYEDPEDRRFHSQTNSCPACGPHLELRSAHGELLTGDAAPWDPVLQTVRLLAGGRVVAIQGIGGFHLAADPAHPEALRRLRRDKERERKPFALMVGELEEARRLCLASDDELRELEGPACPILIFPMSDQAPPHLREVSHTGTLGVMLPYTPLHVLLFHYPGEPIPYRHLVMTSGNLKGEPIVTDPAEALTKLAGVADFFLYHDRRILFRTDDSVERRDREGHRIFLRRSRGYVPRLIRLGAPLERITLGVGADLKSAPALGKGADVYLAPFLGDLEDPVTREDFERQLQKILALYQVQPQALVYDLHPLYHSTRWALAQQLTPKLGVQHHHAHILSVMAEHHLEETLGLAFDGTGYGSDGTIWGGEFLLARRGSFRRLGCFRPFPLPGGEAAVLQPLRIAAALLARELPEPELFALFCGRLGLPEGELQLLLEMIGRGLNSPLTSSLGRIFDAAAALLGLVRRVSYEGEGPIRLEGLALGRQRQEGPAAARQEGLEGLFLLREGPPFFLDLGGLFRLLAGAGRGGGGDPAAAALLFHRVVARAALAGARHMRQSSGLGRIALSGGVFQNVLLTELLLDALRQDGFEVFLHRDVPPGDGGLAVGQVYFLPENE
jgi:hydrogenase maturation protein HypF